MIDIEHVSRRFGSLLAVDDLCLHVPRGELFCLLGPNGAGKTTTVKMLTGLLKPDSGAVRIAGTDIRREPLLAKSKIGYIPDMPFLYDRLTATEFFRFTGDLYRIPRARVDAALEEYFSLFSLHEHRDALTADLSHGLRQRLVYAATFLHDPEVLIIDEPLVGLDPYTIRLLKDLFISRARNGTTILLTTHILALAEDVADRIGIILNGRMARVGTLARLLADEGGTDLEDVFLKLTANGGNPEP